MLWDLSSEGAGQVYSSWNTAVKLSWNCPRETRSYLLQQVLECNTTTAKTDILSRYPSFFKNLRLSTSKEVAVMANLVSRDIRSTIGCNLRMIQETIGMSVWTTAQSRIKSAIIESQTVTIPENEEWRIPFLNKLLSHRQELSYLGEDTDKIHSFKPNVEKPYTFVKKYLKLKER